MSPVPDRSVLDEALAWHVRLENADAHGWLEFTEWLEADSSHNQAYENVADRADCLTPVLEQARFAAVAEEPDGELTAIEPEAEAGSQVRSTGFGPAWRWGALAASVAVAGLIAVRMMPAAHGTYRIETAPGHTRTISLSDGSRIALNGDTVLVLDHDNERSAELVSGEAQFSIRHDPDKPFVVQVGKRRLMDVGTVFNVTRSSSNLRVAVAQGAVRFEGVSRKIRLGAGDSLAADARGMVTTARQPKEAVGAWTRGLLIYDEAPLAEVTASLGRSLGIDFVLGPGLGSRSFTGVIQTGGGAEAVGARIEELLGVRIEKEGSTWTLHGE